MDKMAVDAGSVISSSLFGALAGSGTLPFERERPLKDAITASGRGVKASLSAFAAGFEAASQGKVEALRPKAARSKAKANTPSGPEKLLAQWSGA
jgi:indolepyruvate ferredoxin oxidoreductase beta subunit